MSSFRQRVRASPFIRGAGILALGTAIGQAAAVAGSPILTRLYDPAAFGALGTVLAFATTASLVGSLRLEGGVLLEKRDGNAVKLVRVCGVTLTLVASLCAMLVLAVPLSFSSMVSAGALAVLLWVSIVAMGSYRIVSNFWIRRGRFRLLASYQVVRSAGGVVAQIALGLVTPTVLVLVVTQISAQVAGALLVVIPFALATASRGPAISTRSSGSRELMLRHRNFIIYSVPQTLLNSFSTLVPVAILATLSGGAEVGLFYLVYRVLTVPGQLVAESLRNVSLKKFGELRKDERALVSFLQQVMLLHATAALPIAASLIAFGPFLFAVVFGPEWRQAGEFARFLAIPWLVDIISVPVPVTSLLHC